MCRLLAVRADKRFEINEYLPEFAAMCRESQEYQGHGWGMAYRRSGQWHVHKDLAPVWENEKDDFGDCELLMIHARSAFRDEGIVIENNMPFHDERLYFAFNGELRGVKVKEEGRIGAEKIFNYIKRFDKGNTALAFHKATEIIRRRTEYVRAMNIVMTDGSEIFATTHYGEDPDYFQLYHQMGGRTAFCSQPLSQGWEPIPNHATMIV